MLPVASQVSSLYVVSPLLEWLKSVLARRVHELGLSQVMALHVLNVIHFSFDSSKVLYLESPPYPPEYLFSYAFQQSRNV